MGWRSKMSFWEKTKGFLLSPTETFNSVKDEDWGGSISYFAKWLIIYAILITVIIAVAIAAIWAFITPFLPPDMPIEIGGFLALGTAVVAVIALISVIIGGLIGILIGSLWMHIWVYIVGGRKGVGQTIKAMAYGNTPSLLLGWIPFLGIIFVIWTWVVQITGIRQLHEISTGRAALAYILGAIIIPAIIVAIVFVAFLSTLIGMMPPT